MPGMTRDDDFLQLRDDLTRRFDLVLRPSAGEIARFWDEAARLAVLVGDRDAAERAAAEAVFLMAVDGRPARMPALRNAA